MRADLRAKGLSGEGKLMSSESRTKTTRKKKNNKHVLLLLVSTGNRQQDLTHR